MTVVGDGGSRSGLVPSITKSWESSEDQWRNYGPHPVNPEPREVWEVWED